MASKDTQPLISGAEHLEMSHYIYRTDSEAPAVQKSKYFTANVSCALRSCNANLGFKDIDWIAVICWVHLPGAPILTSSYYHNFKC